jgi:uncharacterized protein (DUF3084 family)
VVTKLYGILLILVLVAVSGVIAYVGDIVGRRLGRKRLSLFGMRPRHTAIAVSVIAGMVITFLTLAVAAALSKDVKDGLFRVVDMRLAQAQLTRDIKELSRHAEELERQRRAAEQQVAESRAEMERNGALLEKARGELKQQEANLTDAKQKLSRMQGELRAAAKQLANAERVANRQEAANRALVETKEELEADVQRVGRYLQMATQMAEIGRSVPVLVGAGQALGAELLSGGQPAERTKAQLEAMADLVDRQARAAGAAVDPGVGKAVIIRHLVVDDQKRTVSYFSGDQVIAAVADQVSQASGGIIVRMTSLFNSPEGVPLIADFQLFNNRLVYHKGEVLAETVIDGRLSEPALMAALVGLLRDEVGAKARQENIMPRIPTVGSEAPAYGRGSVGEMSYEDLFANIGALRRIAGPAKVKAVAAGDTWTIGPLQVGFQIEPVGG